MISNWSDLIGELHTQSTIEYVKDSGEVVVMIGSIVTKKIKLANQISFFFKSLKKINFKTDNGLKKIYLHRITKINGKKINKIL